MAGRQLLRLFSTTRVKSLTFTYACVLEKLKDFVQDVSPFNPVSAGKYGVLSFGVVYTKLTDPSRALGSPGDEKFQCHLTHHS